MKTDIYNGHHTSDSREAVAAFEGAVAAVAAHRPLGDTITKTLEADPDFFAAHALLGFGTILLAKAGDIAKARSFVDTANACLKRLHGGTDNERVLCEALNLAIDGHMRQAASHIEAYLEDAPKNFLAAKLSHAFRFMSGQSAQMLTATRTILPAWSKDDVGYGYLLGCHAFALEECGHHREAEYIGRRGVDLEPADAWGLHAVGHVMEMNRRASEGALWLETSRALWPKCNNFGFHLAWHLALFRMEEGDHASVLEIYDTDISPAPSQDFRDMANAASTLWRLEQEGIDVGDRWLALHETAIGHRADATYVFGALHFLLALVAAGDHTSARALTNALHDASKTEGSDQARVAARVGAEMADIIVASRDGTTGRFDLAGVAERLQLIGGSHAQRDVFMRTLLLAAADNADSARVHAINRVRTNMRSADRFVGIVERRLQHTTNVAKELQDMGALPAFH